MNLEMISKVISEVIYGMISEIAPPSFRIFKVFLVDTASNSMIWDEKCQRYLLANDFEKCAIKLFYYMNARKDPAKDLYTESSLYI